MNHSIAGRAARAVFSRYTQPVIPLPRISACVRTLATSKPEPERDPDTYYGLHSLDLKGETLDISLLPNPQPTHHALACTLHLQGYMPDHLDFVAHFCRHTAHAMQMPCSETIHFPVQTKKWYVIKGPFVHAKTKEVFEQKKYVRALQVFDASEESVKEWIAYIVKNVPAGVDVHVERHVRSTLESEAPLVDIATKREMTFQERVEQKASEFVAGWTRKAK
ncbi:hypothetical protein SpCBS45565_g04301 [Spizellomyces sp. 'palustris']|nr:hypothetical protein SpCBS45565_g04301 [Spizellomyces sp. 'palustris']